MIPLSVGRIAGAIDGRLVGVTPDTSVTDVVVDSRAVTIGAMFVAIDGERVDGHDFAAQALANGASVVLCARALGDAGGEAVSGAGGETVPCIVVDDPVLALGRLAAWVRADLLDCSVVAITGSSGKTSTKDLVGSLLSTLGTTVRPHGSLNTEVGLPLTILGAGQDTDYLVLEMGMRGLGHIAYLAGIARPDVGVVLNVGSAHLGVLGSREAIAQAKGELIESLASDGIAILNADDPAVLAMDARTSARVITFGESPTAHIRATDVRLDEWARPSFTLLDQRTSDVVTAQVRLQFSGEHNVANALAAAAVALSQGMTVEQVAGALTDARVQSMWRMDVREAPAGYTVINDAYNANPESMRAALKTLAAVARGRRSWAVLGEMRELGEESVAEHDAIGRLAVRLDISRLVCVGDGTRVMHLGASNEGSWGEESVHVVNIDAALDLLRAEIRAGDVVLVKASRSVGLESIAERLLDGLAP